MAVPSFFDAYLMAAAAAVFSNASGTLLAVLKKKEGRELLSQRPSRER